MVGANESPLVLSLHNKYKYLPTHVCSSEKHAVKRQLDFIMEPLVLSFSTASSGSLEGKKSRIQLASNIFKIHVQTLIFKFVTTVKRVQVSRKTRQFKSPQWYIIQNNGLNKLTFNSTNHQQRTFHTSYLLPLPLHICTTQSDSQSYWKLWTLLGKKNLRAW